MNLIDIATNMRVQADALQVDAVARAAAWRAKADEIEALPAGDQALIDSLQAQVLALQQQVDGHAAELAALDATHTAAVSDLNSSHAAQVAALQATIADLEAQLAAGGGGDPPAGVPVVATAWAMNERGGLPAAGSAWKWSAFPLDNLTTAYGSGIATMDANSVLTMPFTAPLVAGQYVTIVASKQDTALPPHDREVWSGVWNVPVVVA